MQEGKRQKQVASLIQKELNEIFQRLDLTMIDGGMVSISSVKISPDLLQAKIYLSFFPVKNAETSMKHIEEKSWEIKRQLALRVKLQLRRIPVLHFFLDDTLDYAFKMEEIFKKINDGKKENEN
ncbi:MAG TPA: 30S ribosome-binding factor RbfA [Puia sp.]|jgi:ribosome-binding factor A|nr:30S ribosome-binding factor RbfA [Puia sp.]